MLIPPGYLRTMKPNRSSCPIVLALFAMLVTLACTSKERSHPIGQHADKNLIEAVLTNFAKDWGMPGHPEAIPRPCYLRDTYSAVDRDQLAAAVGAAMGEQQRSAAGSITSAYHQPLPSISASPCKLSTDEEIHRIESAGHVYSTAIISISGIGFDTSGESAAVLLGEARGDLAGSTWIIFLQKSGNGWSVVQRRMLRQS